MANTLVPIYILRSQCDKHGLDTMRTFTLKGNESPEQAYEQMERWVLQRWNKDHPECPDEPTLIREIDKDYRWNTKKLKPVKI
jgi:hypothetical protein